MGRMYLHLLPRLIVARWLEELEQAGLVARDAEGGERVYPAPRGDG